MVQINDLFEEIPSIARIALLDEMYGVIKRLAQLLAKKHKVNVKVIKNKEALVYDLVLNEHWGIRITPLMVFHTEQEVLFKLLEKEFIRVKKNENLI